MISGGPDPLADTITERLLDRVDDCTRKFPIAVVLGGAGEPRGSRRGSRLLLGVAASAPAAHTGWLRAGGYALGAQRDACGLCTRAGELVAQRLVKSRAGVEEILHLDLSAAMLDRARAAYDAARAAARDGDRWPRVRYIQADEEMLPLAPESVDRGWRRRKHRLHQA